MAFVQRYRSILGLAVVILLTGVIFRVLVADRFMPTIDHYDESLLFLQAYQLRPDAPFRDVYWEVPWNDGFPPLQLWLGVLTQLWTDARIPFPYPSDYIMSMRWISVMAGAVTIAALLAVGFFIAPPKLRTLSVLWIGAVWAFSPQVIDTGSFALMDPLIYPSVAMSLLLSVIAIRGKSPLATTFSLSFAILAIYTKYIAVYTLWFPLVAVVMLVRARGLRHLLPWLAFMAVISAVTGYWLVGVHGALGLENTETTRLGQNGLANLLSPVRNLDNLLFTLWNAFGLLPLLGVLTAGAVAYAAARRRSLPSVEIAWLVLVLPPAAACMMLTSSVEWVSQTDPYWHRIRYMLPAAMLAVVIAGLAVDQVLTVLSSAAVRRFAGLLLFGSFLIPGLIGSVNLVHHFSLTPSLHRVWTWSDSSLSQPEGRLLMSRESLLSSAWNRPWSGYREVTQFDWTFDEAPAHSAPRTFFEDYGVAYFVVTDADLRTVYNTPETRAFINQLFPLKTIDPGDVEPYTTTFYRMLPPQTMVNAVFGDQIELIGYDLDRTLDSVIIRPFWRASRLPDENYSMFIHLRADGDDEIIAQYDGAPAGIRRLPLTWDDPAEVLVGQPATLRIPESLADTPLTMHIGIYSYETGGRLLRSGGENEVIVPLF